MRFSAWMPGDAMLIAGTFRFAYDGVMKLRERREVTVPDDVHLPGTVKAFRSGD